MNSRCSRGVCITDGCFFFQAEDGIRDLVRSRGLGDVYKRQLKGCESWAHDEETVIEKIVEMTSFYLHLEAKEIKLDKARKEENKTIYKLIFHK